MTTDNQDLPVAEVPPSTGWKPDLNIGADTWAGMPQEYVEREAAGFVPTEATPLPPSQRTPEGIAAREVAPTVSADIATIRDLSQPEDFAKYQGLQDEQKFVKAVELDLIPEGSKFAPGLDIIYGPEVPEAERRIKPREWGYYGPEQVDTIEVTEAIREERRAVLDNLSELKVDGGYDLQRAFAEGKGALVYAARALGIFTAEQIVESQFAAIEEGREVRAVAREVAREEEEGVAFEKAHTLLPDGQWIGNEQLANLKTTAPNIYQVLIISGFDEANKILVEQQESIETRVPSETLMEQYIRLTGEKPLTIGAFEEEEVKLIDKILGFFTGRGTGKLATGSKFLELSIPGFIAGMSNSQAQLQSETLRIYRYLFKEQTGRFPTLGELPDIKAGLPRGIEIASVIPGIVTAYRWDTMSSDQKWEAIQSDIATAALYGMMAVGLSFKPTKVPIVKYKIVNELGKPIGRTIKIPVYAPDTLGTKFAMRNPALWQRGATPLKIYGETGIKPITPIISSRELILRKPQVPVLPSAFKGGVRIPSGFIPPTRIPTTTYFPGSSYITARGIKINIPAGTITSKGLIPSGMEIWSRAGVEQPWSPFAHKGARVLVSPTTGELTIIDVATGRIRNIGLPSGGAEIAIAATPRKPSTLTMTPEQLAKLKPLVTPSPYIEYEITSSGLVAPRIIPYPTPKTVVVPGVSPIISPSGKPIQAVVPIPSISPVPGVTPAPSPVVTVAPAVAPTVAVSPAVAPTVAPAVAPSVVPAITPTPATAVISPATSITTVPPVVPVGLIPPITAIGVADEIAEKQPIEQGSITWKQGLFWKYIPPPWNQDKPLTLPKGVAPKGARVGGRTPQETIQMIGKSTAVVPQNISIDIGIVDAFITGGGKNIEFRGKGEETDVGERLPSTTQGMSIDVAFPGVLVSREDRRPLIKKKKPKKKARRDEFDFSDILEVRGEF